VAPLVRGAEGYGIWTSVSECFGW